MELTCEQLGYLLNLLKKSPIPFMQTIQLRLVVCKKWALEEIKKRFISSMRVIPVEHEVASSCLRGLFSICMENLSLTSKTKRY